MGREDSKVVADLLVGAGSFTGAEVSGQSERGVSLSSQECYRLDTAPGPISTSGVNGVSHSAWRELNAEGGGTGGCARGPMWAHCLTLSWPVRAHFPHDICLAGVKTVYQKLSPSQAHLWKGRSICAFGCGAAISPERRRVCIRSRSSSKIDFWHRCRNRS